MKKALITGITGQDGSYLAELLLSKGYEVHGVIRRTSSYVRQRIDHLTMDPSIKDKKLFLHYGDMTDGSNISRLIEKIMPDEIYNLAAQSHVKISFDVPEYSAQVDGIGTIRILDAIRELCPKAKFYQACHDTETKAVTPSGIKRYKDLHVGDLVYSINEETKQLEQNRIQKIHEYDHIGPMISLEGKRISQLITENHKTLLEHENGDIIKAEAKDVKDLFLYERTSSLSLPICKNIKETHKDRVKLTDFADVPELETANNFHKNLHLELDTNDFLYLLGLYIGDGYKASSRYKNKNFTQQDRQEFRDNEGRYSTCSSVDDKIRTPSSTILFAIPESDPARQKLIECLKRQNYTFTTDHMNITVTSLPLSKVFSLAGDNVYEKCIPDFAWEFNKDLLESLLNGIIDSDGSSRKTKNLNRHTISTSSQQLASQCLVLSMICQKYPSLKYYQPGEQVSYIKENGRQRRITNTVTSYKININTKETNKLYKYMVRKQDYEGKIWCLEVENSHNFMIERNGKVAFSGNSTSELYGLVQETPQTETTPFYPRSPYAAAKLYAYWITKNYREAYNLFACNGILFNHESERRGENFVTRKITMSVAKIKAGKQKKLSLGNLSALRDWGYAPDYVEAMWLMLQQDKPYDLVIATGENHSVEEFCKLAFARAGMFLTFEGKNEKRKGIDQNGIVRVDVNPQYFRPTEVQTLLGNPMKAKRILGWESKTMFNELVNKMVDHDMHEYCGKRHK